MLGFHTSPASASLVSSLIRSLVGELDVSSLMVELDVSSLDEHLRQLTSS